MLLEITQHKFKGFESAVLINRLQFLTVLKQLTVDNDNERLHEPFNVAAMNPEPLTDIFNFDSIIDDSVVTAADGVLKKMNVISYSRPKNETIQGPQAVKSIKQWLKNGCDCEGATTALGFYFFMSL